MSGFANTVFTLMIGWFRTVVSLIWSGLTDKNGGNLFTWIGNHWIVIVLILCVIGTVIDFSVYLFRWRPLDVIRSYFDRKKGYVRFHQSGPESIYPSGSDIITNQHSSENSYRPLFASNQTSGFSADDSATRIDSEDYDPVRHETDLQQDEPESLNEYRKPEVPADSPYRRPIPQQEYVSETETGTENSGKNTDPVFRPRRRRINVSELFGNPEEDMIHFDPPKPVIDQSEAYHTPVYPRNWKDNGESTDDSGIRS